MSELYKLEGSLGIRLDESAVGSGGLPRYFDAELGTSKPTGAQTAVSVSVSRTVPHHPREVYGVSGAEDRRGRFLVPDGAGHWCAFNPETLAVDAELQTELDLCCDSFKPTVLLDWIVIPLAQFRAAALGLTPLHASGAQLPGMTGPLIFSAWSGVGKTNLVAAGMSRGGRYFGDDRVVVRRDGYAEPSTRRIAVYGYNRRLVPSLSRSRRMLLSAGDKVHQVARGRSGRVAYLLAYAANGFTATRVSAASMGGAAGQTSRVLGHIICRAAERGDSAGAVELEESSKDRAVDRLAGSHAAVMEYEYIWFQRYLQTWRWAKSSRRDPWRDLMSAWQVNLEEYFLNVPRLAHATLPHGPAEKVTPQVWRRLLEAFNA